MTTSDEALLARLTALHETADRALVPPRPSPARELRDLADVADALGDAGGWDRYGEGGLVAELERRLLELLGAPAAAFFPSGVMAQPAALRVRCDRAGTRRIALPDLSRLLVHEDDEPRRLHGFEVDHLTVGAVTPTRAHVDALPGRLAAVLLELPLRDAGYLLPGWDDLVAVADACRARGIALHLDGARLWESAPHYDRELAEITSLADTTYVSFYKGLGGLAGAALVGPTDVIAEARLWRRRHGGTLFSIAPLALGALRGLDRQLPRMGECHAYAVRHAAALQARGIRTAPDRPHTTAFRVLLEREPDELLRRAVEIAETESLWLPGRWGRSDLPGWSFSEVTVTPAMIDAWGEPDRPDGPADALARLITAT